MLWTWLLSFLLGFCVDALYVFYTNSVTKDRILLAVFWSMAISVCGIVGWINALDDRKLLVPYVIGLGAGTYAAMLIERKRRS